MAKQPEQTPTDHTPKPPKQVREQIAQAEAIRAEMSGEPLPSEEGGAAPPQQSMTTEAPPQPAPEAQPAAPPAEDEQSWEQRFRSQQGRFEQTMKNNQALMDRINELEKQVTTLKIKGADEERPQEPRQKPRFVTTEEQQEYGDEFLQVVGRRAKEEYFPEFDDLSERLKRLEGRVDGVGTVIEKTQINDVYAGLAANIPEWKTINRSEQFKEWLSQPDPFSGRIRNGMLQDAFSRHEAGRVVSFFRGFLTEAAGLPQNPQASMTPTPSQNGTTGRRSLEDFAAPGRARSAPQELPPDKPIYTAAWIAKFTADKISGKYRGREADADAIERDIYQAQHEGRIQ